MALDVFNRVGSVYKPIARRMSVCHMISIAVRGATPALASIVPREWRYRDPQFEIRNPQSPLHSEEIEKDSQTLSIDAIIE